MRWYVVTRTSEGLWEKHGPYESRSGAVRAACQSRLRLPTSVGILIANEFQTKKRFGDAKMMLQA